MDPSYFSLDDILSESEEECFDLGYLDDSNNDEDIAADAAVLLPFWMAQPLIQRDIITFSLPAFYNRQFQSAMVADPDAVNLKDHTPYYYELGIKLAQILDSEDLVRLLSHCLTQRLPMIISQSGIHKTSNFTSFLLRLANIERQLFDIKNTALNDFRHWRRRKHTLLRPASSISGRYVSGMSSAVGQKRLRD